MFVFDSCKKCGHIKNHCLVEDDMSRADKAFQNSKLFGKTKECLKNGGEKGIDG